MKFCKTLQSISIGLQYLERDTASRSSVGDASTRLFDHARHLPSPHDTKTKFLLSRKNYFCRDRITFVETELLLSTKVTFVEQKYFCRDKICFCQQNTCYHVYRHCSALLYITLLGL